MVHSVITQFLYYYVSLRQSFAAVFRSSICLHCQSDSEAQRYRCPTLLTLTSFFGDALAKLDTPCRKNKVSLRATCRYMHSNDAYCVNCITVSTCEPTLGFCTCVTMMKYCRQAPCSSEICLQHIPWNQSQRSLNHRSSISLIVYIYQLVSLVAFYWRLSSASLQKKPGHRPI